MIRSPYRVRDVMGFFEPAPFYREPYVSWCGMQTTLKRC